MANGIRRERFSGEEAGPWVPTLAPRRIEVFRGVLYPRDGSLEHEESCRRHPDAARASPKPMAFWTKALAPAGA